MPKGVRRNPFQALLATADKQLQISRERLASAEKDADCIHQKKIRVARVEHDEWMKMVKQLKTSLTIPIIGPAGERMEGLSPARPAVKIPTSLLEDTPPLPDIGEHAAASKKQSINDASDGPIPIGSNGGDAGDRATARRRLLSQSHRAPRPSAFDKCPGLPDLACKNSKPKDSDLCNRCAVLRGVRSTQPAGRFTA